MGLENLLIYTGFALLGLSFGSFFNVVIYRYRAGLSIIRPRSFCPHCNRTLQIADLVPVLSYLFLRGRCRYCGKPISFRYSAVELAAAVLFIALYWRFGLSADLLKYIPLLSLLLIISLIDLDTKKIPNKFVLMILAWALFWQVVNPALSWADAALGLLAGGGITFLIALVSRGGMGGGDIKLLAALGFLAGWLDLLLIFFIAVLLGALAGIILIVFRKKSGKTAIPFGPFIAAAYALVLLLGDKIWDLYFTVF